MTLSVSVYCRSDKHRLSVFTHTSFDTLNTALKHRSKHLKAAANTTTHKTRNAHPQAAAKTAPQHANSGTDAGSDTRITQ